MNKRILYKIKKYNAHNSFVGYEDNYTQPGVMIGIGVDYEEFESGPGNFSTAIIEKPNGEVFTLPIELVKFIYK